MLIRLAPTPTPSLELRPQAGRGRVRERGLSHAGGRVREAAVCIVTNAFLLRSNAGASDGRQDEQGEALSAGGAQASCPHMPSLARASCRSQAPSHSPASLECVSPRRIRDKAPVTARALPAAPGARPRPKRWFLLHVMTCDQPGSTRELRTRQQPRKRDKQERKRSYYYCSNS